MGSSPSIQKSQEEARKSSTKKKLNRSPTKRLANDANANLHPSPPRNGVRRRETQHTFKVEELHDTEKGELHINQYTLTDLLGSGAYGKVYRARDRTTDTMYACKVMKKSQLKRKRVGRFKNELDNVAREIAVWKKLKNPYVVDCIEVIDDPNSDSIYIVSEFMNGSAIRPNSLTCEPVDGDTLRDWASMIVAGLHYLHLNDIIHRDVKPANVLLHTMEDGEQVVKLADFGLSQQHERGQDAVSNTVGTTAFMAPETFTGDEFSGKRTDIWALGVTLFMLAYGKLPWEVSLYSAAEDILETDLSFPEYAYFTVGEVADSDDAQAQADALPKRKALVSEELKDLIAQLLNKDPDQRPMCADIIEHAYFIVPTTPRGTPIVEGMEMEMDEHLSVGSNNKSPRSSPVQSPKPRSRPVSAHKVPPAHSIHTVEKVSVSEDDINSAFTHVHISNMRSKSIAVVRLQSLHRSVTEARGEFDGCAIIAVS
eukprot:INCI632.2.p1 GENE.INCI632.2~~INCI632.2.p1  ORF type:complete len:483 (-),score=78.44 INCI632.2:346-1794(-)